MALTSAERFWEIDLVRGLAILMMIGYHIPFDLAYFGVYTLQSGLWLLYARTIATIFLLVVGISLTLSFSRATRARRGKKMYPKYLKRGLRIFSWGLVITLTTWILVGEGFVVFGILHLIGLSSILAYPVIKLRAGNLALGTLFIALGMGIKKVRVDFPWLLWLGLTPARFYSVDYFPLLPWFGVVLIGIFLGNSLYPHSTRNFSVPDLSRFQVIRTLCLMGRHSLLIYLVHQPLILISLHLLGIVDLSSLTILSDKWVYTCASRCDHP